MWPATATTELQPLQAAELSLHTVPAAAQAAQLAAQRVTHPLALREQRSTRVACVRHPALAPTRVWVMTTASQHNGATRARPLRRAWPTWRMARPSRTCRATLLRLSTEPAQKLQLSRSAQAASATATISAATQTVMEHVTQAAARLSVAAASAPRAAPAVRRVAASSTTIAQARSGATQARACVQTRQLQALRSPDREPARRASLFAV